VEGLVSGMSAVLFADLYRGRRVLVTGHTGFKGTWLALWLRELGAEVAGFALPLQTLPSHWDQLQLDVLEEHGDIRDATALHSFVAKVRPEVVFHLAAQPLVRLSYREPVETFSTNVIGTLNLYEACRSVGSVKAIVSVTTDKVYENRDWLWGYRENDPLGGHDPYSASKACADLATTSYQRSFWPLAEYDVTHHTLLCAVRAGNVVGGGDWSEDRLVPDLMRGAKDGVRTVVRNPASVRPWQHVLEPLAGYLLLGQRLLEKNRALAHPWNFGPSQDATLTVEEVIRALHSHWPAIGYKADVSGSGPHEARLLMLDCSQARSLLGWTPLWDGPECFARTAQWYRSLVERNEVTTLRQLNDYIECGVRQKATWVSDHA
jgi:CDP-glucose 4,6-dehydratase